MENNTIIFVRYLEFFVAWTVYFVAEFDGKFGLRFGFVLSFMLLEIIRCGILLVYMVDECRKLASLEVVYERYIYKEYFY